MIRRSVTQERLDFQLAPTGDTITGRAGLALFQEAALALGPVKRPLGRNAVARLRFEPPSCRNGLPDCDR